jgi:hypothetical protein
VGGIGCGLHVRMMWKGERGGLLRAIYLLGSRSDGCLTLLRMSAFPKVKGRSVEEDIPRQPIM